MNPKDLYEIACTDMQDNQTLLALARCEPKNPLIYDDIALHARKHGHKGELDIANTQYSNDPILERVENIIKIKTQDQSAIVGLPFSILSFNSDHIKTYFALTNKELERLLGWPTDLPITAAYFVDGFSNNTYTYTGCINSFLGIDYNVSETGLLHKPFPLLPRC